MKKGTKIAVYSSLCLIWSSTWLMIKVGLETAPPMMSAGVRFILASLIILAILLIKRIPLPRTKDFLMISVFLGFAQMGVPYALVYWGEQFISSGLTAVLFSIMPLAVAILARFILGDPLTFPKIAGIFIGTAGVIVIFSDSLGFEGKQAALGMTAIIISAVLASLSSVVVKKYSFQYNPFASIFLPITIGALLLTVSGMMVEKNRPLSADLPTISSIIYLGILGTVGAFALYFWIIKHIDVTLLSYMTFIIPVLACFLGWIFLGETVTFRIIIGGGLIFAGIGLSKPGRKSKSEALDGK